MLVGKIVSEIFDNICYLVQSGGLQFGEVLLLVCEFVSQFVVNCNIVVVVYKWLVIFGLVVSQGCNGIVIKVWDILLVLEGGDLMILLNDIFSGNLDLVRLFDLFCYLGQIVCMFCLYGDVFIELWFG